MLRRVTRRQILAGMGGGVAFGASAGASASDFSDPSREETIIRRTVPWTPGQASALCIGISNYEGNAKLSTPNSDARAVSDRLAAIGFDARTLIDPSFQDVLYALASFRLQSSRAELTLLYVAGHGLQVGDMLHLLAKDAYRSAQILPEKLIPEATLLQATADKPRQRVLIMDCCRTPLAKGPASCTQVGALPPIAQAGVCIAYAAQPDGAAYDGSDDHSPFANALLRSLDTPDIDLETATRRMRLDVIQQSQGLQIPWVRSSLLLPVSFSGPLRQVA